MDKARIAIFGCNALGLEVARRLSEAAHRFIVVDIDSGVLEQARDLGFATACIDYTDDDALCSIGIRADIGVIFCMLREDSENVFLTISARALDSRLKIISVCNEQDAAGKLTAAGADKVIDPYAITGSKIHELIRRPAIVEILEHTVFGRIDLKIAEITIAKGSSLAGRRLAEVKRDLQQNLVLLGLVDPELGGELTFGTRFLDHKLDAGDVLVVIGPNSQIESFRAEAQLAPDSVN
jgi:voltage-gated potassium channel